MNSIRSLAIALCVTFGVAFTACSAGPEKDGGGGGGGGDTSGSPATGTGSPASSSSGFEQCGVTTPGCNDCYKCAINPVDGPCHAAWQACEDDPICVKYTNCIDVCNDDIPCIDHCGNVLYPAGKPKFDASTSCFCNECTDCSSEMICNL